MTTSLFTSLHLQKGIKSKQIGFDRFQCTLKHFENGIISSASGDPGGGASPRTFDERGGRAPAGPPGGDAPVIEIHTKNTHAKFQSNIFVFACAMAKKQVKVMTSHF